MTLITEECGMSKQDDIFKWFRKTVLKHGIDLNLDGLPAIARYLGYTERNFYIKVAKISFTVWQLKDLVKQLHFTEEEKLKLLE